MFKTNKDVILYSYVITCLIGGIILITTTNLEANTINYGFIGIMCIFVIVKFTNKKFGSWLEKPFKK